MLSISEDVTAVYQSKTAENKKKLSNIMFEEILLLIEIVFSTYIL